MSATNNKKSNSSEKRDELRMGEFTGFFTELPDNFFNKAKYVAPNPKEVTAQIPGTIYKMFVKSGQKVKTGDKLLILEAMKMRNQVTSPITGIIKTIKVQVGDVVRKNALLVTYE